LIVAQIRKGLSDKNDDGPNNTKVDIPHLIGGLLLVVPSLVAGVGALPVSGPGDIVGLGSHTVWSWSRRTVSNCK